MTEPVDILKTDASIGALCDAVGSGRRVVATGAVGSMPSLLAGAMMRRLDRPIVLMVAHLDDADEALDELESAGVAAVRLPALETLPGEGGDDAGAIEQLTERISVVRETLAAERPMVHVCSIQSCMQLVPKVERLDAMIRTLRKGGDHKREALIEWLAAAGYSRVEAVEEPGDFALRGGLLDIFPPGGASVGDASISSGTPVRLDFFGDTLERITEIDLDTQGSDREVGGVTLVVADPLKARPDDSGVSFLSLIPKNAIAVLVETMEVVEQGRGYFERVTSGHGIVGPPSVLKLLESRFHAMVELNQFSAGGVSADHRMQLPVSACPAFSQDVKEAMRELVSLAGEHRSTVGATHGRRVVVCCQNAGERSRLAELLEESKEGIEPALATRVSSIERYLHRGVVWDASSDGDIGHVFVPYHEVLNRFTVRRRTGRLRAARAMDTFLDLQVGDHVVHVDHGIAKFTGLTLLTPREMPGKKAGSVDQEEFLTLEFAGRSKLHVPASQIEKVQKYVGGFSGSPPLSTLGGVKWKHQKERAAESVRDLAAELLRVRAAREHMPGLAFPGDTNWQREFEAEFPYTETDDQLAALAEIKRDMQAARPMDRLICGDVGFGKTELAIRAAFKACEFGKQVAVLVPTTVLAEQHERTFRSRFAGYPFRIESLSRFKTNKEANDILAALRKGHVDVIIGTHRLLSGDVRFSDLGLVVVDEEQRFGVEHKEALLKLRLTVDVITLSATPIPRTLHMSMLGIRDISSLTTPPLDRRAIVTEVIPYNERRIEQAIARELSREGQVYFVHNRVHNIKSIADDVRRLAPGARVVIGHGQMSPHELEDVMLKFMRREADILVSTTIIESGIDIASANTMIINDADRFGLADLHQLRGRVGRSKHRAYCYMLTSPERPLREVAKKRLKAIEQYSMLGAGFKIAMRDLEIRGAGNILGAEQSGHIAAVGYEMFCQLLERAVHDLRAERPPRTTASVSIEIGVSGTIPRGYIPSEQRRLEAYRRLAAATTLEQLVAVRTDMVQAYGEPPKPTQRLLDLAEIRIAAMELDLKTITIRGKDVVFVATTPDELVRRLRTQKPEAPDRSRHRTVWTQSPDSAKPTVRVLPVVGQEGVVEVYFRPPPTYLEPETLVRVLRHRLKGDAGLEVRPASLGPNVPSVAPPRV